MVIDHTIFLPCYLVMYLEHVEYILPSPKDHIPSIQMIFDGYTAMVHVHQCMHSVGVHYFLNTCNLFRKPENLLSLECISYRRNMLISHRQGNLPFMICNALYILSSLPKDLKTTQVTWMHNIQFADLYRYIYDDMYVYRWTL